MSTRILRDERGYARKGPTQVIRTRPHACGRNCPLHAPDDDDRDPIDYLPEGRVMDMLRYPDNRHLY